MKTATFRILIAGMALALQPGSVGGAANFDEAMKKAAADYELRLRAAADELTATRARIAQEKAPLLERMRAAQNRVIAASSEKRRLETSTENVGEDRRKVLKQLDDSRKTASYITTLAHDGLKALSDGFAPGESGLWNERAESLRSQIEDANSGPTGRAALDAAEFMLEHTRQSLGGYTARGRALLSGTNRVVDGTFAFAGPETYFLPDAGAGQPATVRLRDGSTNPIAYELADWPAADATAFFGGQTGRVIADSSGGKALRLKETRGTIWEHIDTGGVVAYAIVVVGLVALLMILQKMRDLARMAVDGPVAVQAFLGAVASGTPAEADRALESLKGTTRELFAAGLRHRHEPKSIMEEHLQSVLLDQRIFFERRLPLLAVIATAAPLMGLLGTVVGMVKTFALITVFGTGNAAKLSSGISEVLVATELGLVVAIPALVAHGFLAHRIHKKLSQLERYALQFVTAAETAKVRQNQGRVDAIPA